jgi:hypothetical protein
MEMKFWKTSFLLVLVCGFCLSAANAQSVPTATITTGQGMTHNILRQLLPLPGSVASSGGPISYWFADLFFCGASTPGTKATLIGVVYAGTPPNAQPLPVLNSADCSGFGSFKTKPHNVPVLAVQMSLEWVNWNLILSATSVTAYSASPPPTQLSSIRTALLSPSRPVAVFSTRGFSIPIAGQQVISLDASVYFGPNATQTTLYRANTQSTSPGIQPDPGTVPFPADCLIEVSYAIANAISSSDLPQSSVPLGNVASKQLVVDRLSFSGAASQLTVQGTLDQMGGSSLSFPVSIQWAGEDLAVSKVSIQVNPQTCAASDLACVATNNILNSLAPQIQSHYQTLYAGSLLRPTSYNDPVNMKLLGVPISLRMRTIKAQATDHSVIVQDIVGVEKQ